MLKSERQISDNKKINKTNKKRKKSVKKIVNYDCKRCKPIMTLENTEERSRNEPYPCTECRKNLDIQVTGDNDCLFTSDEEDEPWYANAFVSGPKAIPNFDKVFPKTIIQKATKSQCKEGKFPENCLKKIERTLCCCPKSDEETFDPCNPPKKPKSVKPSKKDQCKCPPVKDPTVKIENTVKKCIGHSLIKDDDIPKKSRKKNAKNGNNKKKFSCESEQMTKWLSKLCTSPNLDLDEAVEGCEEATERIICCTQINEGGSFKARKVKKPKRKKVNSNKGSLVCKCSKT